MNPSITPAFYRVKSQQLSFAGLVRLRGWWGAPLAWIITRLKDLGTFIWGPTTWGDTVCDRQDLSPRCLEIIAPHQEHLVRLGFTELSYGKLRHSLNRVSVDNGGIHYLDASRTQYASVSYVKSRVPPPINEDREKLIITFTATYPDGTLLTHTDFQSPFEPPPNQKIVRHKTHDAAEIHRAFVADVKQHGKTPRHFPDLESFREWYDTSNGEVFQVRVDSGLYVKATDAEIARAYRRLPNPTFPPPLPQ